MQKPQIVLTRLRKILHFRRSGDANSCQKGRDELNHRPALSELFQRRQLALAGVVVVLTAATAWGAYQVALDGAIEAASGDARRRLALFDRTLEAMIERFHYLPATIAQAEQARDVLTEPGSEQAREQANSFLSKLNETAGADELFLMDREGSVAAASNWWTLESLVGRNFSFRPYFAEAMAKGSAKFYAVGISTSVPGYFLSQRLDTPNGVLGVAVAKVNLGEIEATWWRSGELIGIVDEDNVVILSTRPDWRYRPLAQMAAALPVADQEQRYGTAGVGTEPVVVSIWPSHGKDLARLAGGDPEASGDFVLDELRLPTHGWRLVSFTALAPLQRGALTAAAAAGLGCTALAMIVLLLMQQQRIVAARLAEHDRLEQRVAQRTRELREANEMLRAEIAERQRAEQDRRTAQAGLVQAAKMASLGQALAGVAHEVSQPVAALSTQVASVRLIASQRQDEQIAPILSAMDKVVARLSALTGHLRTFARKETRVEMHSEIGAVIANALELANHKLKTFAIDVEQHLPPGPVMVAGNPVHLEQVLINLISNAADAMEHSQTRLLAVRVDISGTFAAVAVSDTGEGIPDSAIPLLFDPFHTTKEPGRGLGLGLSISYGLIRDSGGRIEVASVPGRGSTFTIHLPLASHQRQANEDSP